jgi:hypothetical protein
VRGVIKTFRDLVFVAAVGMFVLRISINAFSVDSIIVMVMIGAAANFALWRLEGRGPKKKMESKSSSGN